MIVVTIILFFFLGVIFGKFFNNKEINEINETNRKQLEEKEKNLQLAIEQKEYQLKILREEAENRGNEYYNKELQIAIQKLSVEKNKMERALEDYIASCQKQKFSADENLKRDIDLINQEKQKIFEEVEALRAKRDSLIEAQKKQEELETKKDFYRVQLKDTDIEDIKVLLPLGEKLHSPEILYKLIWSTYYLNEVNNLCARVLPKKEVSGIYKVTNISNGKVYIGRSVDVAERWKQHIKSYLGIGTIAKTQLYSAMRKDGAWNYTFELLEEVSKDKLSEREKYYISFFGTDSFGYNQNSGG